MKATIFTAALAASLLLGCGGGASSPPSDNTAAYQQAISNVAAQQPQSVPYTGAFVTLSATGIAPTAQGFVAGTSEKAVATSLMNAIIAEPVKYDGWYRALLSADGIRIVVSGQKIGVGAVSGLPLYSADTIYVAKLTSSGLTIN